MSVLKPLTASLAHGLILNFENEQISWQNKEKLDSGDYNCLNDVSVVQSFSGYKDKIFRTVVDIRNIDNILDYIPLINNKKYTIRDMKYYLWSEGLSPVQTDNVVFDIVYGVYKGKTIYQSVNNAGLTDMVLSTLHHILVSLRRTFCEIHVSYNKGEIIVRKVEFDPEFTTHNYIDKLYEEIFATYNVNGNDMKRKKKES